MKKIIILLSLVCLINKLSAQDTDSLKLLAQQLPADTNQLKILLDLSGKLFRAEPDSALVYAHKAKDLALQLDRKVNLGYALKNIGLAYYIKGDFSEVLNYWEQSLNIFESVPFPLGISNLLNNLGAVYFSKGDDPKALEYYLGSLRIAEEIADKSRIATAYVNIGAVYFNKKETHEQALDAYAKALETFEALGNQDGIGTAALNLGEVYLEEGNTTSALVHFNKSLNAFEKTGGNLALALNYIGTTYAKNKELDRAIPFHQQAYQNAESKAAKVEMSKALKSLADVYQQQNKFDLATNNYQKALAIAQSIETDNEIRDAYEGLASALAAKGDYKNAFTAQTNYDLIKEKIQSEAYDEKIGNLRFQFDLENKEKEIALLNKDNDLKEVEIEQANTLRNFLYAIGGLLLIILGGISFQYWYVKKSNNLLAEERNRSEEILLNILPKDTADELKTNGFVKTRKFENCTVLFTDFKAFTKFAETVPPEELVKSVDYYFKKFDEIIGKYGLEKIKTIGDSYMCAGGLPATNDTHPHDAVKAALEIRQFAEQRLRHPTPDTHAFEVRIGINTGPIVAGVVGITKFQYDIWGNTVNVASRMESASMPGKINISEHTYQLVKDNFECTYRGEIEVKHAGTMKMYFVEEALQETLLPKSKQYLNA